MFCGAAVLPQIAVLAVAKDRMTQMGKMTAQLVLAAGFRLQFHQAVARGRDNARSPPASPPSPGRGSGSPPAVGLCPREQIYRRFCPALPPAGNPAALRPSASRARSHGSASGSGAVQTAAPAGRPASLDSPISSTPEVGRSRR